MGPLPKSSRKILGVIEPPRAEGFLLDVANLSDRWWKRSGDERISRPMKMLSERYPEIFDPFRDKPLPLVGAISGLRDYLRRAWDASDARHRDWYLFEMRREYRDFMIEMDGVQTHVTEFPGKGIIPAITVTRLDARFSEPPLLTPIEVAAFYFQTRIGDRAKHCGGPDCPAPYFIAVKRWQKYCSLACAGPAGRESKRKWWHEHKGKGSI